MVWRLLNICRRDAVWLKNHPKSLLIHNGYHIIVHDEYSKNTWKGRLYIDYLLVKTTFYGSPGADRLSIFLKLHHKNRLCIRPGYTDQILGTLGWSLYTRITCIKLPGVGESYNYPFHILNGVLKSGHIPVFELYTTSRNSCTSSINPAK